MSGMRGVHTVEAVMQSMQQWEREAVCLTKILYRGVRTQQLDMWVAFNLLLRAAGQCCSLGSATCHLMWVMFSETAVLRLFSSRSVLISHPMSRHPPSLGVYLHLLIGSSG